MSSMKRYMRLGIAFQIFSGLELLKPAIRNVRPFADFVVGVYSEVSYNGDPAPSYMKQLLEDLLKEKLLDKIVEYKPTVTQIPIEMSSNDRNKRELGRVECVGTGCTHYMSMDCDEFYDSKQFSEHLKIAEKYDVTIAPIYDCVNLPLFRSPNVSTLYVPVIQNIYLSYAPYKYGVLIDPARTVLKPKNIKICTSDELVMYHLSTVRISDKELHRKYCGHSHYMQKPFEEFLKCVKIPAPSNFIQMSGDFGVAAHFIEFKKYMNTDNKITVLMATIPYREKFLAGVIDSLYEQVDELRIIFNDYPNIPDWVKAKTKIKPVLNNPDNYTSNAIWQMIGDIDGYVFTCDDDILYPPDYVSVMIKKLQDRNDKAVVTAYGEIFIPGADNYMNTRKGVGFASEVKEDTVVDICGCGCSAFNTRTIKPKPEDFPDKFTRDLWFSVLAAKAKIPIIRVSSGFNWVRGYITGGPEIRFIWPANPDLCARREEICTKIFFPLLKERK